MFYQVKHSNLLYTVHLLSYMYFIYISGCSTVFHDILGEQKLHTQHVTVEYTDMSAEEFELVVVYMYTGHMCFNTVEQVCYGLYAAERFALHDIKTECTELLQAFLNTDYKNALKILQQHTRYYVCAEHTQTYTMCQDIISKHYTAVLECDELVNMDEDCMKILLSIESQEEVAEIDVFRALLKWLRATCIKKSVETSVSELKAIGGELIYLIRYTLIPEKLLGSEVAPSGLLTNDCIAALFQRACGVDVDVPFCTEPRHVVKEMEATAAAVTTLVITIKLVIQL